jgi:CHASE3 domain sensor protein
MMQRSLLNPLRRVSLPVLLAAGFAILVAISGGTLWLVKAAESDADLVAHTLEVQGNLHTLLRFVQFAESGKRAYLLSRNPADLEVYRTGVQGVEETFATLRRLTADNQTRQNELDGLEPVLRSRLQDMAAAIAAGEAQDQERVLGIMEHGLSLMADITARLERMIASEEALLATRSDQYRQASRRLLVSTIAGVLLIILLATASTLQVRRSTRSLLDARRALEVANVHLEATVEERTAALRESNAEIQRYAYIVSHDLRAPLVNIMGFTSELEALRSEIFATAVKPEDDPERVRVERDFDESIGFIKAAIAKMDALIGAILKISREGHRVFRPERLNMRELIQGLADAQRHQTEAVGATVTIGDLPPLTGGPTRDRADFWQSVRQRDQVPRPGPAGAH